MIGYFAKGEPHPRRILNAPRPSAAGNVKVYIPAITFTQKRQARQKQV